MARVREGLQDPARGIVFSEAAQQFAGEPHLKVPLRIRYHLSHAPAGILDANNNHVCRILVGPASLKGREGYLELLRRCSMECCVL